MADPDTTVAGLINTASISGLVLATVQLAPFDGNIIKVPELAAAEGAPGKAVFVLPAASVSDEPFLGSAKRLLIERVDLVIRSEVGDYAGGLVLARAVHAAVRNYTTASGYYSVGALTSPQYTGRDEENRHLWSLTVGLESVV